MCCLRQRSGAELCGGETFSAVAAVTPELLCLCTIYEDSFSLIIYKKQTLNASSAEQKNRKVLIKTSLTIWMMKKRIQEHNVYILKTLLITFLKIQTLEMFVRKNFIFNHVLIKVAKQKMYREQMDYINDRNYGNYNNTILKFFI